MQKTKQDYSVKVTFPFLGSWYHPGDTIQLSKRQASYLKKQGRITTIAKASKTEANANKKEKPSADSRK